MNTRNILISNPSSTNIAFLPYIFGVLKQHCENFPELKSQFNWLEPVFLRDSPARLLSQYDLSKVDVLGLSCYVWNFSLQCEIARLVRQANPDALVVAGGPEPDWNDAEFFLKHPEIDIVVMQEGEAPFAEILKRRLSGHQADFSDIPGLILNKNGQALKTLPPVRLKELPERSPYCDEKMFDHLVSKYRDTHPLSLVFETNRGCPYKCVFCDWGSNTYSRIRLVHEARVRREIEWISKSFINRVYVADANFGILERDEAITDHLCAVHRERGWPKIVDICVAKNHIDRVTRICLRLHEEGLMRGALVGFQTTNQDALAAMERMNMSSAKHVEMLNKLTAAGAIPFGTIIVGCPGDTVQTFQKSVCDLLEMGFHRNFRYFLYALLPNAEASTESYRSRWELKTRKRKLVDFVPHKNLIHNPHYPVAEYVTGNKSLSEDGWIKQNQFVAMVTALHCWGPTRLIAQYFRRRFNLEYLEFYDALFQSALATKHSIAGLSTALCELHFKLRRFLDDSSEHYFFDLEFDSNLIEHERWILLNVVEDLEQFYEDLEQTLRDKFPDLFSGHLSEIRDLFTFQEFSISPIKSNQCTKARIGEFDWNSYFAEDQISSSLHPKAISPYKLTHSKCDIADTPEAAAETESSQNMRWLLYSRQIMRSFNYKDGTVLVFPQVQRNENQV